MRPGANFVREMQAGLDSCDRLIAVLSPDYEESDHCQAEWASFYNKDPSGRKRLLLPMRVKLGKLNSLASQIVYTDLVFKKGEDRISAFLDAVMQGTRPSPYTYGWTKTGVIAVTGGGMDTPFVTQNRDVKDLSDRLDATREYAKKLAARINSGALQINKNYATKLEGYADALPENADGNIYLADTMARGVRRDINSDIDAGYLPDSAINDFVGLLELHSGICPYFPQLTNFYEDVKTGALSDPLPIEAILAAEAFVSDHTPDTFDESVSRGFENLDTEDVDALGRDQSIDEPTTSKEHRVLSQDPVDGADPEREMLQAKAHALEELDRTFKKVEKTADYAERVSKVGEKFGAIVRPVLDLLKTFGDGGL